ncbi:hypothetical protein [Enterocloster citroniae]|nr:hypothetical protein [Enterocloster citroniae]DAT42507.1 MAG TPA: RNA-dependent RNA polymerase [Caudoviricetes sp.]
MMRFIDEINGITNPELHISSIRREIKRLRRDKDIIRSRPKVQRLYEELDHYQFKKDYVCVVIDNEKDYYHIYKRGFKINGTTFRRLLGTTGGIKTNTIVFVNELLLPELMTRINNGRDPRKEFSPAKLEAYIALTCSSSTPVSMPRGIVVVHDCITHFKDDVIELDDTGVDQPKMRFLKNHEIELNNSDGYGLGMPSLMEQWGIDIGEDFILPACVIRNSFCKGAVVCVDFQQFASDHGLTTIQDIWGNTHSIFEVALILTESMLKLWDSYSSIDDYLENCKKNHYTFAITKSSESELENMRTMNYQFLQSYDFTDEEIDELIAPTVNEIQDILSGDYRKTILYVKGIGLNDDNVQHLDTSFATALMIDKEMQKDPFVQDQIRGMIRKRIDNAKVGVLNVPANYSIICGDPYSLCQSMFGLEVTGLLQKGQIYSKYWIDHGINRIASFRAPMTSHNNIRLLDVVHNSEMDEFYRYITTPTIFNSWDTCAQAMNGFDFDGDCVINTSLPLIVNNTHQLPAICCVQRKAPKCVPTSDDLMASNIKSFGNAVGPITNKITSMYDVKARFSPGSREYNIMDYRIKCGQLYQQNAIDKSKGIEARPMPAKWYNWISNKVTRTQPSREKKYNVLNRYLLADKKPYFMKYIYPSSKAEYEKYLKSNSDKCILRFSLTLDELISKPTHTAEEEQFLKAYYIGLPLGMAPCTLNRICWKIESIFDKYYLPLKDNFDYSILKSDVEYTPYMFGKIKRIYDEYVSELREYSKVCAKERIKDYDSKTLKFTLQENFRRHCVEACPNADMLCNIILDICYTKNGSKRFAWDMCGETIIQNLLKRNNYKITYPTYDQNGDIEFGGNTYRMTTTDIKVAIDIEDTIH